MNNQPIDTSDIVFALDGSHVIVQGPCEINGTPSGKDGTAVFLINFRAHIFLSMTISLPTWSTLQSNNGFYTVKVDNIVFPKSSVFNLGLSATIGEPVKNMASFTSNYSAKQILDVTEIRFSIINCPNWIGEAVAYNGQIHNCRLKISLGDYELELDAIGDSNEEQRKTVGFSITGLGRLKRQDGAKFSNNEQSAQRAIDTCMWGLNFATGHWPFMPAFVFMDGGVKVGVQYSVTRHMPYDWGQTWFAPMHPQALKEVIRGLYTKLSDPIWEKPIKELINWYSDSISQNGTSVGSLIWLQTALEMIAWTYITQDPATRSMSEEDFDSKVTKSASQKIAALLDGIRIDKSIPTRYTGLQTFSNNLSAARTEGTIKIHASDSLDGSSIITHVRNVFVHPMQSGKRPIMPQDAQFEAKYLALEYLEFAILKVLNTTGNVICRSNGTGTRNANAVSPLPWMGTTTATP